MSLQDFRRIALAHDLLVRDPHTRPSAPEWTGTEREAGEAAQERIPAATTPREGNG
ncbi:MAG TPA: hypothetical protein VJ779_22810 [Acetobacteraceae bacterium]|nr:hypothetical protein [Acetobacteraceae bacterium]